MPKYVKRYRRRSSRSIRRSKKISAILGICGLVLLAIAVIVAAAVVVGLKLRDEAEKHTESTELPYIEPEFEILQPSGEVRAVDAQIFRFEYSLGNFLSRDITDFSIMLRDSEGTLYYNSAVAQDTGWDSVYKSVSLADEMADIHEYGGYVCSYMYLSSFADGVSIAEIRRAYETELVIEAANSGVDEILLLGIDVTDKNFSEVLDFLADIKSRSGNCKIGIELDYGVIVTGSSDSYIPQMLLQICDFISLDASSVPCKENAAELGLAGEVAEKDFYTAVEEIYYYTSGMGIRITFNGNENSMYKAIEDCTYVNRQMHE